jgi:hypothetical protein
MILDRVFGLIAAVAFALGVIVQVELLSDAREADFDPRSVTSFALALIAIIYVSFRVERKYGLRDPIDESVEFGAMAFSLPNWAIAVSIILSWYVALLAFGVHPSGPLASLLDDRAVVPERLSANGIFVVAGALLTTCSFITAVFLLIRKPIKEFR